MNRLPLVLALLEGDVAPVVPHIALLDRRADVHRHVEEAAAGLADLPVVDAAQRWRSSGPTSVSGVMPDMLRNPPSEKNERTMSTSLSSAHAGAGPENAGIAPPGMRVELVVDQQIRIRVGHRALAFAFRLPAELERWRHGAGSSRRRRCRSGIRRRNVRESNSARRQQWDRRRARVDSPNGAAPARRELRRSCRARGRDRRRSRWCARGIRPGCSRSRRRAAACGSGNSACGATNQRERYPHGR